MRANIGWNIRIENRFTTIIHIFSGAVRQEKCSFACLHEFFSSQKVSSLYVYKVLEEKNSVRQVKACYLLDFESLYNFMHGSSNLFVHSFLVADLGKFGEEETWNP